MAGGVDDVDLVVVVVEGGVLRKNRDAAFFFEVVGVHDPLGYGFVGAEGAGLTQHGVDEGGFTMVDVRDDGNIEDGLNRRLRLRCSLRLCPVCALRNGVSGKVRVLPSLAYLGCGRPNFALEPKKIR